MLVRGTVFGSSNQGQACRAGDRESWLQFFTAVNSFISLTLNTHSAISTEKLVGISEETWKEENSCTYTKYLLTITYS